MVLDHANVYLNTMAIHTKAVGRSVLLTQIAHRIEPVLETNAKIHALVSAHRTLNAELSITWHRVPVELAIREIRTVIVVLLNMNVSLAICKKKRNTQFCQSNRWKCSLF